MDQILNTILSPKFDNVEQRLTKENNVKQLEQVGMKWVKELAVKKGLFIHFSTDQLPCLVLIQGSAALGVSFVDSDVDAVMVVPCFVSRYDFFDSFITCLRKVPEISNIILIPEAFVPLIRMKIGETAVDLALSCLGDIYVPPFVNFDTPSVLYHRMDKASIRSLSGVHCAQIIFNLVPDFEAFSCLLKVVRMWVKTRDLGSYVHGFLPNIAWQVMTAFVCKITATQENLSKDMCICKYATKKTYLKVKNKPSTATDTALIRNHLAVLNINSADHSTSVSNSWSNSHSLICYVHMFFSLFSQWSWPKPVMITPITRVPNLESTSWTTENSSLFERDLMPVITPVFPNKNSTIFVRPSTRQLVINELKRDFNFRTKYVRKVFKISIEDHNSLGMYLESVASEIVQEISLGKCNWAKLFEPYDPKKQFRHFIRLDLSTKDHEELINVGGFIDSKLGHLTQMLEDDEFINLARVIQVKLIQSELTSCRRVWLIGLAVEPVPKSSKETRNVDITNYLSSFYDILSSKDPHTDFNSKVSHCYCNRSQLQNLKI